MRSSDNSAARAISTAIKIPRRYPRRNRESPLRNGCRRSYAPSPRPARAPDEPVARAARNPALRARARSALLRSPACRCEPRRTAGANPPAWKGGGLASFRSITRAYRSKYSQRKGIAYVITRAPPLLTGRFVGSLPDRNRGDSTGTQIGFRPARPFGRPTMSYHRTTS